MAKPQKAGRHTQHDGRALGPLALHRLLRDAEGQRAGGGNAQRVQGFAGNVLAQGRTQHRAAVGASGVGRRAAALELPAPELMIGCLMPADQMGAAIAQLRHEHAKLMAGIDAGLWRGAGQGRRARQNLAKVIAVQPVRRKAQGMAQGGLGVHQLQIIQWRGRTGRAEGRIKRLEGGLEPGQGRGGVGVHHGPSVSRRRSSLTSATPARLRQGAERRGIGGSVQVRGARLGFPSQEGDLTWKS